MIPSLPLRQTLLLIAIVLFILAKAIQLPQVSPKEHICSTLFTQIAMITSPELRFSVLPEDLVQVYRRAVLYLLSFTVMIHFIDCTDQKEFGLDINMSGDSFSSHEIPSVHISTSSLLRLERHNSCARKVCIKLFGSREMEAQYCRT
jgi:hypothetical protein